MEEERLADRDRVPVGRARVFRAVGHHRSTAGPTRAPARHLIAPRARSAASRPLFIRHDRPLVHSSGPTCSLPGARARAVGLPYPLRRAPAHVPQPAPRRWPRGRVAVVSPRPSRRGARLSSLLWCRLPRAARAAGAHPAGVARWCRQLFVVSSVRVCGPRFVRLIRKRETRI